MWVRTWQCECRPLHRPQESWRREHLWSLVDRLGTRLRVPVESPIIPLVLGAESETMRAAGELLAMGFHVPPIRPPTVKPMTCRCCRKSCAIATCIHPGPRSLAAEAEQACNAMYPPSAGCASACQLPTRRLTWTAWRTPWKPVNTPLQPFQYPPSSESGRAAISSSVVFTAYCLFVPEFSTLAPLIQEGQMCQFEFLQYENSKMDMLIKCIKRNEGQMCACELLQYENSKLDMLIKRKKAK